MPRNSKANGRYYYDKKAADTAVEFFAKFLTHVKGEWGGHPFKLDKWQVDEIIKPIFGWKRADGTRKYRRVYIEIPRKNGKTTLAAGLGVILTVADQEPGAEVYSAAADRDQAAISFNIAREMVEANTVLSGMCEVYRRSIVVPGTASSYHVLSADAPTKHGKNSHGIIFDELHAQPNRLLYDVLKTSMGSRRQPLMVMLTTAGYDRTSVCWEEHEYALRVKEGLVKDESYLPVIYAATEEQDWTSPKVWAFANPGLGKSVKKEFLQEECDRAKESPAYQNTFRRLYLNQWTEQCERWIDMAVWDENNDPPQIEDRAECFMGLDLASTADTTALALCFPNDDGGYSFRHYFFVPEECVAGRSKKQQGQYDDWCRQEYMIMTDGNVCDYEVVKAKILELSDRYDVREIAYDRWNATQIVTQLTDEGAPMVPFGQGYASMGAPTKEWERLVRDRMLRHGGNPVLRWHMSNCAVRQDPAGNLKPAKDKSADKIDGVVAGIMALGRAIVQPNETSVYEQRGVISL